MVGSEILYFTCITCNEKKPASEYYKDRYTKSGYKSKCKKCIKHADTSHTPVLLQQQQHKKNGGNKRVGVDTVAHTQPAFQTHPTVASKSVVSTMEQHHNRYHPYNTQSHVQNTQPQQMIAAVDSIGYVGPNRVPLSAHDIVTDYEEFDWNEALTPGKHFSIADCAPRNSGKTTTISYLWPLFKERYDAIIFFCQSLKASIYKEFLTDNDRRFCFSGFNEDLMHDLKNLQDATENAFHFLLLFDDDVDFNRNKNNAMMVNIYTKGRNDNMTIWFSTQSMFAINPNARDNIDYFILRRPRTPAMREKVVEQFLYGIVPTPPECTTRGRKLTYLNQWIDANTRDYTVIIIDYLNDAKIYKFRAEQGENIYGG